jgi:hypothetical protein
MPLRKRAAEVAQDPPEDVASITLHRLRNMWEFANLCQWIYLFGKVAKIDDAIDIEVSPARSIADASSSCP